MPTRRSKAGRVSSKLMPISPAPGKGPPAASDHPSPEDTGDGALPQQSEQHAVAAASAEPVRQAPIPCPIVGIGASAGGVEALSTFLDHLPPDTGAAFVLLLHSDPSRKSYAVELYSRHTLMNVVEAADGTAVQPNSVYIAPSGSLLTVEQGRLRVRPVGVVRGHTIDALLASLAVECQQNAVGIVLSGTGADGTLGIRAIKEHGGITMAQSEGSARHFEMPGSAIATGLIDVSLPVESLPSRLAELLKFEGPRLAGDVLTDASRTDVMPILEKLRTHTGHDFAMYKQGTVGRRITRRLQLLRVPTLAAYLAYLHAHPEELDALHSDLLIGVTRFFRDPDAFESLRSNVIVPLLDAQQGERPLKVWVAGCSTGEEAYSIAILFAEELAKRHRTLELRIFATDLDPAHLSFARAGIYPKSIEEDVSAERLGRFFLQGPGGYQVIKSVREMLVFSVHNLLRDPPFSKLDLVSCRNVLIYFRSELQRQVLPLFHYSLRDGGYLFLGPSEGISGFADAFAAVHAPSRIFARKPGVAATAPTLSFARPSRLVAPQVPIAHPVAPSLKSFSDYAERILLEHFAPAAVVVDEQAGIVRFLGRTGKYVEPAPGAPEMNLLSMARRGLRTPLRKALDEASQRRQTVTVQNVTVGSNGGAQPIDLIVRPLTDAAAGTRLYLVVFQDVAPVVPPVAPAGPAPAGGTEARGAADEAMVHQLESELRHTREDLKSSIEDLEISNEELRSTNEEYLSVNEELQSTVEELETTKEETHSINEELSTVNAELASKVEQLASANNDIRTLLESTQIPTIVLDGELRVRSFTSAISPIVTILPSDIGRPITDLKLRIDHDRLPFDAQAVLRSLVPIRREARASDGTCYEVRFMPYRTTENKVSGVVVTFSDITGHKKAADDARVLTALCRDSRDAIIVASFDGRVISWNRSAERIFGYTAEEASQLSLFKSLTPPELRAQSQAALHRLALGETVEPFQTRRVAKDGRMIDVWVTKTTIIDDTGAPTAIAETVQDLTERVRAERSLRQSEESFRALVEQAADGIFITDRDGRFLDVNHAACDMLGYSRSEVLRIAITDVVAAQEAERVTSEFASQRGAAKLILDWRVRRKDGSQFDGQVSSTNLPDNRLLGIIRDISEQKRTETALRAAYAEVGLQYEERGSQLAEAIETINLELANRTRVEDALRESRERLSVVVRTAAEGIITINQHGIIDSFNPAAEGIFGYQADEVIGKNVSVLMPSPYRDNHGTYLGDYLRTGKRKIIGIGRELVGVRKDGTIFPMDLNVGEGADGVGPVFTGIVRDLTSRKESENRLRIAERLASIGALAAGLGHDMNNMLLPMRAHLNAAIAAADPSGRSAVPRSLTEIEKSVDYLQQLADGLHFLASDPDQQLEEGVRGATNLAQWWAQAGTLLSKPLPKHVRIVASFPKGTKRSSTGSARGGLPDVVLSPHQLSQVMLNLLINAGQAIPPPDGRSRRKSVIRVFAKLVRPSAGADTPPMVKLYVQDTGIGMTEEVKRRAFDMFFTTKVRGLGTGLGLSMVDRIVRNAGGTVEIESKVGQGTTVIMTLPAVLAPASAEDASLPRTAVTSIVDPRAARMVQQLLEASKFHVKANGKPDNADLWVVDPELANIEMARAWLAGAPRQRKKDAAPRARQLVILGPVQGASAGAWRRLHPIIVEDPNDFLMLRQAISLAVGQHHERGNGHGQEDRVVE